MDLISPSVAESSLRAAQPTSSSPSQAVQKVTPGDFNLLASKAKTWSGGDSSSCCAGAPREGREPAAERDHRRQCAASDCWPESGASPESSSFTLDQVSESKQRESDRSENDGRECCATSMPQPPSTIRSPRATRRIRSIYPMIPSASFTLSGALPRGAHAAPDGSARGRPACTPPPSAACSP
jgi:hypothetical protein